MSDPIDEIIVTARRRRTNLQDWFREGQVPPDSYSDWIQGGSDARDLVTAGMAARTLTPSTPPPPPRPRPNLRLVVNNPTLPKPPAPLPEIIVRAKRPILGGLARGLGGLLAGAGFAAADLLNLYSQQQLDQAYQDFVLAGGSPRRRDSPLRTTQPEVIPEIIVTARRPIAESPLLPNPYVYEDPWVIPPIEFPSDSPTPEFEPLPDIVAPTAPVVRPEAPREIVPVPPSWIDTLPNLDATYRGLTGTQPQNVPFRGPQRRVRPERRPEPARRFRPERRRQPVRRSQPVRRGNIQSLVDVNPVAQAQAQQARRKCPPCPKKKKPQKRDECFKKMVEERSYEKWDKVYKWEEIDCTTGRSLE